MILWMWLACAPSEAPPKAESPEDTSAQAQATADSTPTPRTLRVVTWNTGTTEGLPHDAEPDDGYSSADATLSDTWYGDGLAWQPAVDAARAWLGATDPDLVAFQEMFLSDDCAGIPPEAHANFVCATWQPGDDPVVLDILGPAYQVACHLGKSDKCLAVHERVGTLRGCEGRLCLDGLEGSTVEGCGSGSRVGLGTLDAIGLSVVTVHGTSGLSPDDQACRTAQVEQIFVDLGDSSPAVRGPSNLVLGDLNTDPGRFAGFDPSAARWLDFAGDGLPFQFHTEIGEDAPGSYQGLTDIDHVLSDALDGSCWIAGVSDGHPAVLEAVYFDHHPVVCDLTLP